SYVPKSVRAAEAVKANPEKSDRAIAAEIGASPTTVGKARKELSTDGQLDDEPRTGLAGKVRRLPQREEDAERRHQEIVAYGESLVQENSGQSGVEDGDDERWPEEAVEALSRANKAEQRCNELVVALNAKEVTEGRDWPLDKMTKRQMKKRDDALGAIAFWQKSLQKLYAEVTEQPAWRVEVINKDGVRLANG